MTALFSSIFALLLVAVSAQTSDKGRDFTGYNSSPMVYDTYDNTASYTSVDKWPPSSIASFGSCGGTSILKPILAGLIGVALLKLPILIAAKLLLLKFALPIGLLTAAAPLALPLVYMFFSRGKDSSSSTPAPPSSMAEGRALYNFLESSSCLERIACSMGRSQSKSPTAKTFSWMLKSFESILGKQHEARSKVGSYRAAYMAGAYKDADSCSVYSCTLPELIVRQGESSYKLL